MNNRLKLIRWKEKEYHDDIYENHKLYAPGTWLQKPVKTVMDLFHVLDSMQEVNILDLGCGIGRNSIPLAERMHGRSGTITCVDLLESAIRNLLVYGKEYGVTERLEAIVSDIASYRIDRNRFDFIFAVSALEHLESGAAFERTLGEMIAGTRAGGVNCIIMNANIMETDLESGETMDPMFELALDSEGLIDKLQGFYQGWELLRLSVKPYDLEIERDKKKVRLQSDVVTWAAKKPE